MRYYGFASVEVCGVFRDHVLNQFHRSASKHCVVLEKHLLPSETVDLKYAHFSTSVLS